MSPSTVKMIVVCFLSTLVVAPRQVAAADEEVTFQSLLLEMVDRDALARFPRPAYTCRQASSYERKSIAPDKPGWFANHDWSHFIRPEQHSDRREWVMMEDQGAGCLVRFWMGAPHPAKGPAGTLRIYLDGVLQQLVCPFQPALIDVHVGQLYQYLGIVAIHFECLFVHGARIVRH